jgi:hypothetical protein
MFRKLSLLVLVLTFGLAISVGCQEEPASPPTTDEVQEEAGDAMDEAGDAMDEVADEAEEVADDTEDAVNDAMGN